MISTMSGFLPCKARSELHTPVAMLAPYSIFIETNHHYAQLQLEVGGVS